MPKPLPDRFDAGLVRLAIPHARPFRTAAARFALIVACASTSLRI
jgi:hypothetical protein